jgi:hypothetical protein
LIGIDKLIWCVVHRVDDVSSNYRPDLAALDIGRTAMALSDDKLISIAVVTSFRSLRPKWHHSIAPQKMVWSLSSSRRYARCLLLLPICISYASAAVAVGNHLVKARDSYRMTFPAAITKFPSHAGGVELLYEDPGPNQYGIHEYRLKARFQDTAVVRDMLIFTRSVEVAWAPARNIAFVNNFIGSNLSDCMIVNLTTPHLQTLSVSKLLFAQRKTGQPKETSGNAHFNLSCGTWTSSRSLSGYLLRRTDAGQEFSYRYQLDVDQRTLVSRG